MSKSKATERTSGFSGLDSRGLEGYFILTYALVLLSWGVMAVFQMPGASVVEGAPPPSPLAMLLLFLGGFSPSIAGVIVTWRVGGHAGLRDLWKRATRFDLGGKWYLAVLLIPLLMGGLRLGVHLLRGGTLTEVPLLAQPFGIVGFILLIFLGGPLSEELGWRGFALDRLLARWNALVASLVLGVFWAFWHLPLFFIPGAAQQLYGDPVVEFPVFALGVVALAVVFTWLHVNTRRSVWAAILLHFAYNLALSLLFLSMDGGIVDRLVGAGLQIALAAFIVVVWGPRLRFAEEAQP